MGLAWFSLPLMALAFIFWLVERTRSKRTGVPPSWKRDWIWQPPPAAGDDAPPPREQL
jgi:hypothetical protein